MSKPPLIRAVKAKPPMMLQIAWSTGEKLPIDVSPLIKRFKLYAPLRNGALFGKAKADPWGHAVNWPGNIDMGADQLYELACEQGGKMGARAVCSLDGGIRSVAQCSGRCAGTVAANDRALSLRLKADPARGRVSLRGAKHQVEKARRLSG